MKKSILLSLIIFASLSPVLLKAQKQPGLRDSLYSEVLQEQRLIYVNPPENYSPDSKENKTGLFMVMDLGKGRCKKSKGAKENFYCFSGVKS